MVVIQEYSYGNKHDYFFEFKGKQYRVHSIVRLTEYGRNYLGFAYNNVILTEVYYPAYGKKMYKYRGKDMAYNKGVINKSTDTSPDELIEKIVSVASEDYASREILGDKSPVYTKNATKHTRKDWEIPELRKAWIVFILVFISISIFQDLFLQLLLRFIASWIFWLRRQAYIEAYTTYTHDEDDEITKRKLEIEYGFKQTRKDDNNE